MRRVRLTKASVAVCALVVFFMVAIGAITLWLVRDRSTTALYESEAQAMRFVSGAEVAVNRSLLGLDVLLASMDKLLNLSVNIQEWIDVSATNQLIQGAMRQNLLAGRVGLMDGRGHTIASSDSAALPQEWNLPSRFVADVLAQPVSTLVLSAPLVSFRSGELVIYAGRHMKWANGSAVIAVAEVAVPQLASILIQGADIEGLQATLERDNGELLVAAPARDELVGKMLSPPLSSIVPIASARHMAARLGGESAIVATRNTLYGGVYITASIPLTAALHDVDRETRLMIAVAAVLGLMVFLAGAGVLWYLNRLTGAQSSIARAKETLDQALESMVSGFVLLDAKQRIVNWNRRFMELHPWLEGRIALEADFESLAMVTARHVFPECSEEECRDWVSQRMVLLNGQLESRHVTTPDGVMLEISERSTPDGGTVIVYQDVTRLRRAIADVEMLAFYDPLTGLPNRRLLNDRLQQAILVSQRTGRRGALLFLDLDHFKTLNDTSGHLVGDMLLQQVAKRLLAAVRDEDTVARLGGDEFVVMLQGLSADSREAATQTKTLGDSILANLNLPYQLQSAEYASTCSVGATLFGERLEDANELLKQADIAMYQVKTTGRNALCFFDPKMLTAITMRADLERDLRHALAENQFVLYFQVQVAEHARPVGAEVLIRWLHPRNGMVPPMDFIGLAEETGLIIPIGEWVIRTACQQLKEWETVPCASGLQLAVNVSARQFMTPEFVDQVRAILRETGARANLLKLELTESVVLDNIKDAIEKMQALKAMGVRFSMDDFGTGYSSLSYLTRLPLDQLKIDQSFVRNIDQQATDLVVVDTIIGLASNLGLEVIAEGVETTLQRDLLLEHGCRLCQGYLFGKPMPVQAFEAWLIPNRIAL